MENNQNNTFYKKAQNETLKLGDVFSGMFKKHSKGMAETLWTAGTLNNVPTESEMLSKWVKPWIFVRVLIVGIALIIPLILMDNMGYGVYSLIPTIFIGSLVIPLGVVIFFFELNIPKNISLYQILMMIFVGGCVSLIITGLLSDVVTLQGAQWASITEEPAKILAICIFLRKNQKYYILNGILIGSAIGAGFAFIETTGYVLGNNASMDILIMRGVLSPGAHVAWAAIEGGVLVKVMNGQKFSPSHLIKGETILYFAISTALHFTWNYPFLIMPIPFVLDVKYIILIVGAWLVLLKLMNNGVNEVVALSNASPILKNELPKQQKIVATQIQGVSGMYSGSSINLSSNKLILGRDSKKCNLVFTQNASKVSRVHCILYFENGNVFVTDNNSSNGTFIKGYGKIKQGEKAYLSKGSYFYLGDTSNMFVVK